MSRAHSTASSEAGVSLERLLPLTRRMIRAVHTHCVDCCAGSPVEVRRCEIRDCALWPFRLAREVADLDSQDSAGPVRARAEVGSAEGV